MLTEREFEYVREKLLYMHCEYAHYMNCDEREIGSNGMVAGYGSIGGGRTNRTSDLTAMTGLRRANIPRERLEALEWIDCAWRVFCRGTMQTLSERPLRPSGSSRAYSCGGATSSRSNPEDCRDAAEACACTPASVRERQRRATVSYVLYYKAFLGYTFQRIAEMGVPSRRPVSRQRIHDFWNLAVEEVGEEAKRAGLV